MLVFWVVRRVKGQKMAQNDKKLCSALYLRNHTSYDLSYGSHVEKDDIISLENLISLGSLVG